MIRAATINDINTICRLKLKMFEESGHSDLLHKNATEIIKQVYKEMYLKCSAIHFIKEMEGKIVACAGAFIKNDIPYCFYSNPFYGFIGDVYTLPEYRGNGYATELTSEAVSWLKTIGVQRISLLASEQGRAIYERMGFTPTDEMVMYV